MTASGKNAAAASRPLSQTLRCAHEGPPLPLMTGRRVRHRRLHEQLSGWAGHIAARTSIVVRYKDAAVRRKVDRPPRFRKFLQFLGCSFTTVLVTLARAGRHAPGGILRDHGARCDFRPRGRRGPWRPRRGSHHGNGALTVQATGEAIPGHFREPFVFRRLGGDSAGLPPIRARRRASPVSSGGPGRRRPDSPAADTHRCGRRSVEFLAGHQGGATGGPPRLYPGFGGVSSRGGSVSCGWGWSGIGGSV